MYLKFAFKNIKCYKYVCGLICGLHNSIPLSPSPARHLSFLRMFLIMCFCGHNHYVIFFQVLNFDGAGVLLYLSLYNLI
jgi:hypothetical protein